MLILIEEISNDLLDTLAKAYVVENSRANWTRTISALDVIGERRYEERDNRLETDQDFSARFKQTVRDQLRKLIMSGLPLPPPDNPEVLIFVVPFNISYVYTPHSDGDYFRVEWQSELLRDVAGSIMVRDCLLRREVLAHMQRTAQHYLKTFVSLDPFAGGVLPWPCVVAYLE